MSHPQESRPPGITITIPTYWSRPSGNEDRPEDAIFDHPTPLDRPGTLGRCLESLARLSSMAFRVLIITAPANESLAEAVQDRVEDIIAPFRRYFPVGQFGPRELGEVRRLLEIRGLDPKAVGLAAYAEVRNCQILGAVLLDSEVIVGIDDDEVVPPGYLGRALESLELAQELEAGGVAGIYLDADGDYRLRIDNEDARSQNIFVRKAVLINEQFERCFARPGRLVDTPLALGGNMVFSRILFRSVAFDPGITRGEDIDYLMNSRLLGYRWLLDKELAITHLPPKRTAGDPLSTTPYAKLQQDVLRFIYQREKLRVAREQVDLGTLDPDLFEVYPGAFLREDLEAQALEALRELRPHGQEERFFASPEELLRQAVERADRAHLYFAFNEYWRRVLQAVESEDSLKDMLQSTP